VYLSVIIWDTLIPNLSRSKKIILRSFRSLSLNEIWLDQNPTSTSHKDSFMRLFFRASASFSPLSSRPLSPSPLFSRKWWKHYCYSLKPPHQVIVTDTSHCIDRPGILLSTSSSSFLCKFFLIIKYLSYILENMV
jgi:hypothetical protein